MSFDTTVNLMAHNAFERWEKKDKARREYLALMRSCAEHELSKDEVMKLEAAMNDADISSDTFRADLATLRKHVKLKAQWAKRQAKEAEIAELGRQAVELEVEVERLAGDLIRRAQHARAYHHQQSVWLSVSSRPDADIAELEREHRALLTPPAALGKIAVVMFHHGVPPADQHGVSMSRYMPLPQYRLTGMHALTLEAATVERADWSGHELVQPAGQPDDEFCDNVRALAGHFAGRQDKAPANLAALQAGMGIWLWD